LHREFFKKTAADYSGLPRATVILLTKNIMTRTAAQPHQARCPWSEINDLERHYHDTEWGVPQTDDRVLFEFLILEGAQAGLSWDTVLKKREHYRAAFANFEAKKVAQFNVAQQTKLLQNEGIIRNRLKIASAVTNARLFLDVQAEHGTFARYVWGFVDGRPIQNKWKNMRNVPATTPISDAMSKDLKKRGFKFVGSTICYAYMQATGMVNDHLTTCPRFEAVREMGKPVF
jgi:DNA-3-methyladenine glycosylase I